MALARLGMACSQDTACQFAAAASRVGEGRKDARFIGCPVENDRQFVDLPRHPGQQGGALAPDHQQGAVDVGDAGGNHAAHAQQFAVQGAVTVLGGDHQLAADGELEIVEQAFADDRVAAVEIAQHGVRRQLLEERVDGALGGRLDADQQDAAAIVARLGQGRQVEAGEHPGARRGWPAPVPPGRPA